MIAVKTEQSSKETSWRLDTAVPRAIRAARQRGRKGKCRVINITKNGGKTEGHRRRLQGEKKVKM